jgi:hypothetical protein
MQSAFILSLGLKIEEIGSLCLSSEVSTHVGCHSSEILIFCGSATVSTVSEVIRVHVIVVEASWIPWC